MSLDIRLDGGTYFGAFLRDLAPVISRDYEELDINLETLRYIDLMQAIMLVAAVNEARNNGKEIRVNCKDCNEYLQRINFYEELGVAKEENFIRHDKTCSLLEISNITKDNDGQVVNGIMRILQNSTALDYSVLQCLNYCFWEMVDNIQEHAKSCIGGYTVVQKYPRKNKLEINLVDTGRGIRASLSENASLAELSEEEALRECIKEGMTSGSGRGNGLFHTTNFVKENGGRFLMHSCSWALEISGGVVRTFPVPFWQGTAIHLEVNSCNDVLLENIFGDEIPTTVEEADELINGLW